MEIAIFIFAFLSAIIAGNIVGHMAFFYMTASRAAQLAQEPGKRDWAGYAPPLFGKRVD